jgi:ABC-type lipoprotein export system ATPase subunit
VKKRQVRIRAIRATNVPPVAQFEVQDLADVVVIAGANGVGKTRLLDRLIQSFRSPAVGSVVLEIEATSPPEAASWKKNALNTGSPDDVSLLRRTLTNARKRTNWRSSVIHFESDRSIQQIRPFTWTWELPDPWEENYGWEGTFGGLRSRFEDTIHSLFRKFQGRRDQMGKDLEAALKKGPITIGPEAYPDPLTPFKAAFSQLLAPKELLDPDPKNQRLLYTVGGETFGIDQLSSGEREVVNIVFDFLLRSPSDCIVFFDEPELHLHPELSYKLLQTLRGAGERNQFIFCTHSPDIITASLDNSVVFIGPPRPDGANQAVPVREDDETNQALRLLGHSVGIVALGKKIVLIEGQATSLDKQVYGAILKNRFPELVLVPSGGKGVITSFGHLNDAVLNKTIWGVEFYMVCDRDAVPLSRSVTTIEAEAAGRLRILPRYHLENYFLDPTVLAEVFQPMESSESWLSDPAQIDAVLAEIASRQVPYAVALQVAAEFRDRAGNLDLMPKGSHTMSQDQLIDAIKAKATAERGRLTKSVEEAIVGERTATLFKEFKDSVKTGLWRTLLPGRLILAEFANRTALDQARIKTSYIRIAGRKEKGPFADIIAIFWSFTAATSFA